MNTEINIQEVKIPAPRVSYPRKQALKRGVEFPFLKLSAVAVAASVLLGLMLYVEPSGEPFDLERLRCEIRIEPPAREGVEVVKVDTPARVRVKPRDRDVEVVEPVVELTVERDEFRAVVVAVTVKAPVLDVSTDKLDMEFTPTQRVVSPFIMQVESYLARYKAEEDERMGRTIIDAVKELPKHIAQAGVRTRQRIENLIKPKQ